MNRGCFKKGQVPWNKGLQYRPGGRCAETQFKPGHFPVNTWQPLGTERRTKDGLREVKVSNSKDKRWRTLHTLIWEMHNGPVPAGHIVVFRDKNPENLWIKNLECISREENMRRNTCKRYPKEIADLIQLRGALLRQINKRA